MHWRDVGFVLSARAHGENSLVVEVLTQNHGRALGLVRGGRTPARRAHIQSGNFVWLSWRARLAEHLGQFTLEPDEARAQFAHAVLRQRLALEGIMSLVALARLLPEHEPHPFLYALMEDAVIAFGEAADRVTQDARVKARQRHGWQRAAQKLAFVEFYVLRELGFGLDLERCALTGQTHALAFVSPRTGRAVSAQAGKPWSGKLLPLPAFLLASASDSMAQDFVARDTQDTVAQDFAAQETVVSDTVAPVAEILASFRLTGHFLEREIFAPRAEAKAHHRAVFLELLARMHDDQDLGNHNAPAAPSARMLTPALARPPAA